MRSNAIDMLVLEPPYFSLRNALATPRKLTTGAKARAEQIARAVMQRVLRTAIFPILKTPLLSGLSFAVSFQRPLCAFAWVSLKFESPRVESHSGNRHSDVLVSVLTAPTQARRTDKICAVTRILTVKD